MDLGTLLSNSFLNPEPQITEIIPPKELTAEVNEGEIAEKELRDKAEIFLLDRYPELAEFPDLQDMFFRLNTVVFIIS